MICSKTYKTIFIHNQKTGGSSIEDYFFAHVSDVVNILPRHTYATQGLEKLGQPWFDFYSFGFVRNPWARLVSWYSMIVEQPERGKKNPFMQYVRERASSFEEFLDKCTDTVAEKRDGVRYEKSFVKNQLDYFSDDQGKIIVNFIGRFENLNTDFQRVIKAAGLPEFSLQHTNPTTKKDYRTFYTDRTRQLVVDRFSKDIQHFGYEF